jgi:hypothetical protein
VFDVPEPLIGQHQFSPTPLKSKPFDGFDGETVLINIHLMKLTWYPVIFLFYENEILNYRDFNLLR